MKEIFFIFATRKLKTERNEHQSDINKHRQGIDHQCSFYVHLTYDLHTERIRFRLHSPSDQLPCNDPDRHVPVHLRQGQAFNKPSLRLPDHSAVMAAFIHIRNVALRAVGRRIHPDERMVRKRFGIHDDRIDNPERHRGTPEKSPILEIIDPLHRRSGCRSLPFDDPSGQKPFQAEADASRAFIAFKRRL